MSVPIRAGRPDRMLGACMTSYLNRLNVMGKLIVS